MLTKQSLDHMRDKAALTKCKPREERQEHGFLHVEVNMFYLKILR